MVANDRLWFHLGRGNPGNDPVGIGFNKQVFGKSLGGQIFRKEVLANKEIVYHKLENGTLELFDSIVPTDIIKSKVNYRAVFITNYSIDHVILDTITVSNVIADVQAGFALTDVDIAVEGLYTIPQVMRDIPSKFGHPGNPSIYLDDEYDSTNKLASMDWKKTLDVYDLPADIPFDCCLKIWVRRRVVVDKIQMPDFAIKEGFTLTVNEYNSNVSTPITFYYEKIEGRIPLSNWFDFTVTPGKGKPVVMSEFLPKNVDLSEINILKVYGNKDKVLIFYYTQPNPATKNYMLLVVQPNDISKNNKYVQVIFEFDTTLPELESFASRNVIDIQRSFYDDDRFYIFWDEHVVLDTTCQKQFFGFIDNYDQIAVDTFETHLWTSNIFASIAPGYDNRKIETYKILDHHTIRQYDKLVNVEHFDDLFILFTVDTRNRGLLNLPNVNLNRNELLYIFEKDIISREKYTHLNTLPGDGAEIFSQRLYPTSLPKHSQQTSFNNAKNAQIGAIVSNSVEIDQDTYSPRKIKTLLDGTRYVDLNSVHLREFKIGNNFVTYELPPDQTEFNNLFFTTSIAVNNDTSIYHIKKDTFLTTTLLNNVVGSETYERPLFQQNAIDAGRLDTLSIPIEWIDRIYKDEWVSVISTLPDAIDGDKPFFKLEYNFHRNIWQATYFDVNGVETREIINNLQGQQQTITETPSTSAVVTTGSSGSPGFGKLYTELDIRDIPYIIEPDVFQPLSVKISTQAIVASKNTQKYLINIQVYFKGNIVPLVNISTVTTSIAELSYIFINPDKTLNLRINYMDLINGDDVSKEYYIQNMHSTLLNKYSVKIGKEFEVNPQTSQEQSEFKFYRAITISGIDAPPQQFEQNGDITIPIILYGNGYQNTDLDQFSENLGIKHSFDFSKVAINDRSMRFYYEGNSKTPLSFKIGHYDYDKDYAVIWLRIKDFNTANKKIFMYYGKTETTERYDDLFKQYIFLKGSLYPTSVLGAWHFDSIIKDNRLSFNQGKILNMGEPLIYEKTFDNELHLTRIDKEYMYGIAKVYKSNYFDVNMELPDEEDLFLDPKIKEEFFGFVKSLATVFKPGYTEINEIKNPGFEVLEAGGGTMGETNNRRVSGLVALTPNSNVNTYYERAADNRFLSLTSFTGYTQQIDFVVSKPMDTLIFKSGILRISGKTKSETIKFEKPFKDKNYFVFISSPTNHKVYWNVICENRFTISCSHFLEKEISWIAVHRDVFGGVYTPNSLYVGQRTITGAVETLEGESPTTPNLTTWYNNEMLIKPDVAVQGDPGTMFIDPTDPGYSLILSSNENINIYWTEKEANQFRIKTSSPIACTVHWFAVKNGIEWWQELL